MERVDDLFIGLVFRTVDNEFSTHGVFSCPLAGVIVFAKDSVEVGAVADSETHTVPSASLAYKRDMVAADILHHLVVIDALPVAAVLVEFGIVAAGNCADMAIKHFPDGVGIRDCHCDIGVQPVPASIVGGEPDLELLRVLR